MARGRFIFWLDYNKDDHLLLAETIDELKAKRAFSSTLRMGIEIVNDLRQGKLDSLFRHFPWVKAEILKHVQPQVQEKSIDKSVKAHLERLEKLLIEQGNTPLPIPGLPAKTSSGSESGPKAMNVPKFELPVLDNDEDEFETIVLKKDTSTDAGRNLVNSLKGLL